MLSPLLYSFYTHDLDKSVDSFCNILQYADDIVLYFSSKNINEIVTRLNSALYYLGEWLSMHGLSLSVPKSSVVIFTRKRHTPDVNIVYNNQSIPVLNCVKFLGVLLDSKLSGSPHMEYMSNKCEKNLQILRAVP